MKKKITKKRQQKKKDEFEIQIIICSGVRHIEKVIVGLAMALGCASAGAKTVVFLAMEGAAFANPEEGKLAYVNYFNSVQEYFDMLLEAKVRIEACTTCVENYSLTKKSAKGRKKLRKGIVYAGLSTAAIRCINTNTLVF